MDLLASHLADQSQENRLTEQEIVEQVACLTELASTSRAAQETLPAALALVRSSPHDHRPQLLAATLLERARTRDNMADTWAALFDRFPHLNTALRYWVRWLNREGKTEEAVALLQRLFDDAAATDVELAEQAELYSEIRDPDASDALFQQLIARFPDNVRVRVMYGKTLFARGEIIKAFDVLDPVRSQKLSPTAASIVEKNDRAILAMETIRPRSSAATPSGPNALFNAISLFRSRECRTLDQSRINGITFYTGSLGAGGAERQMTQIASAFHHRSRTGRTIGGKSIEGTVSVIVNTLDASRGKSFFKSTLEANGVPLEITQDMAAADVENLPERLEILEDLLPILPKHSRFGLERLAAHLQRTDPDVLYIWQDGAVLTGALAALVAGVPRIAISFRGLPPNLRPHMMKPEYRKLYQALAGIPGVTFNCNSARAAAEYARWLKLDDAKFSVLNNAVLPMTGEGEPQDEALWSAFAETTSDAAFTLGGVFRFTPNKRGLLWIDFASAALKRFPELRFVLVGDGDEFEAARAKATITGLADRILFVGKSSAPGFWYEKCDAVMLLSENEGLPNVLIEAQTMGKPVISTPAGGSQETFSPGRTGFLLSSATDPSEAEFLEYIGTLITDAPKREIMGREANSLAQARFSLENVLTQTVRHFYGARISPDDQAANNVTQLSRPKGPLVAAPRIQQAYNIFANN